MEIYSEVIKLIFNNKLEILHIICDRLFLYGLRYECSFLKKSLNERLMIFRKTSLLL